MYYNKKIILGLSLMDLRHFDTSDVTPVLVKLYDKHRDYAAAQENKPKMRVELTEVVSDLLDIDLNARERELISDVLIGLLHQAENDLRQALAERLAVLEKVPLRLVLEMANDDIAVAGPVLRKSTVLGDLDLVYLIKSKDSKYWREIAKRKTLSDHVMDVLSDTNDFDTAMALVKNETVELTPYSMSILADLAQGESGLSTPLLRRDEVTIDIAKALMGFVGDSMKAYILERYDLDAPVQQAVEQVVDEVVFDIATPPQAIDEFVPDEKMVENAAVLGGKQIISPALLIKTLKRGQNRMFLALLSQWSGIDSVRIIKGLQEPKGYYFAAVCKVCNMNKSDFISLYLLTNFMRSSNKAVQTADFNKASAYFDMLELELAKKLVLED